MSAAQIFAAAHGSITGFFEVAAVGVAAAGQPAPGPIQRIPAERADTATAVFEPGAGSYRHADAASEPLAAAQQPSAILPVLTLVVRFKKVFLSAQDVPVATTDGCVPLAAAWPTIGLPILPLRPFFHLRTPLGC